MLLSRLCLCFWISIVYDVWGSFWDYSTGVHRPSFMCRLILFIKFGKLLTIIFKYSFCLFFSLLLLGIPLYFCVCLMGVPHVFKPLFFFFIHLPSCSLDYIIPIALSSSLLIFPSACSNLCWAPPVTFSFQLYFQLHNTYLLFKYIPTSLFTFSIWGDNCSHTFLWFFDSSFIVFV